MNKVVIFGASYPDVLKVINDKGSDFASDNILFIDDVKYPNSKDFMGFPIAGNSDYLNQVPSDSVVINNVHATPKSRFVVSNKIEKAGFESYSLIHGENKIKYCSIGRGVFIHQCFIGANVKVGNHVSIKIGSIINHDNLLNDYCFIGPGVTLCGDVKIGRGAYIGAGAIVKEHVVVGEGAIVGAGAIVLKDVKPWTVVFGSPAREIRKLDPFDFGVKLNAGF